MKIYGNANNYIIEGNHISIQPNMIYGFVYNFSEKLLPYINNIAIYDENKQILYHAQICQMYETDKQISFAADETFELYVFPQFIQNNFYNESLDEAFNDLTVKEKNIPLNRWNETAEDYYKNYLLADNKKEIAQTKKSHLLEIRTLKQFKFSAEKYSQESKIKLLKFIWLSLACEELAVIDEIAFRDYHTIFQQSNFLDAEAAIISEYILTDIFKNLTREYNFYNHDYLADYHSIRNLQLIVYPNTKVHEFLIKRLYITLNIAFTEDGLGKENTPNYYKLLGDSVKNIIETIGNEHMNMFYKKLSLLNENLQWFKIYNNSLINFGDSDNISSPFLLKTFGRKLFENTGYAISTWDNNSALYIKFKTLSIVHSHCDDGSFVYTHEGQPIFIDPGLYKYSEQDPTRIFVRSLKGHNNVTERSIDIKSKELNHYILQNSEYKKFLKKGCGFVSVLEEDWEKSGYLSLDYKWLEDIKITRVFKINSNDNFQILHKIETKDVKYIQFRFNLDTIFNGASIEQNDKKTQLIIKGKTKEIIFDTNKPVIYSIINSYKCEAKEALTKIQQIVFTRQVNGIDEVNFNIIVKNTNEKKPVVNKEITNTPTSMIKDTKMLPAKSEVINGKTMKYLYFKNPNQNCKKLVIVFQSLMVSYEEFYRVREDAKTYEEFKEMMDEKISKHSFFYFKDNFDTYAADFLYVEDNNSDYYGWYLLDHNYFVNQNYVTFLNVFIQKQGYQAEDVFAFGSSKGGFASLLLGVEAEKVGNVISVIPQISLIKYFNGMPVYKKYFYEEMLKHDYKNIYKSDNILNMLTVTKTNITLFTGVADGQYRELLKWVDRYKGNGNLTFEIFTEEKAITHNDILKQNIRKVEQLLQEKLAKN